MTTRAANRTALAGRMIGGLSVAAVLASAGAAFGQCTPHWDTAIGNPGIDGGYAAAIRGWTDGLLYVGGSFSSAGGSTANQYLARWDPATSMWSPVGTGISGGFSNAFITSMLPYTPPTGGGERLVVGGFYDTAGGVPETASLAMWNGTSWEAMGTGWTGTTRGSIWSLAEWNGLLYAGGGIVNQPPMLAGRPWAGLDSWDGTNWTPIITSITGFGPTVFALQVFDDGSGEALYAVGRFSSINGVSGTSSVARWDGTNWTDVGGGLTPTSTTGDLEAATVFDDGSGPALYVAGSAVTGTGLSASNVARWDGASWTSVGGMIGTGRLTSIKVFDDGSGAKLYIGGTAMPQINYVARWENNAWVPVGGGVTGPGIPPSNFPSVFGLGVFQDNLVVAGNFTQVNSMPANGLAEWTSCAAACYANCDNSTAQPILNVNDFICFQGKFAAGDTYANCDLSTQAPVLNVNDFICFQSQFAAGCP